MFAESRNYIGYMKQNSKLSLALHTLGHMAVTQDRPMTSDFIAQFHHTNPVVVRRVLGSLREAGLLTSEKGHAGGWRLAKAPEDISVAEVYLALGEPYLKPAGKGPDTPPGCAIRTAMEETVTLAVSEAEAVFVERLRTKTLADLTAAMGPALHS